MQRITELSDEEKIFWFSYIETKIGLVLPAIQQRRFEKRIIDRINLYKISSDEFFKRVKTDIIEWQSLIDELIIAETSFFRHPASYGLIKSFINENRSKYISMWSVGCSTGEEAWSLAMLARENTDRFKIMATDVSEISVSHAKEGVYSKRKLDILPEGYIQKYFQPSLSSSKLTSFIINDSLREYVSFYKHNLIEHKVIPFREIDIIFCQNVLIYFRKFVQRDILNRLANSLAIGGILVMAPGEARTWKHAHMQRVEYKGTLAFQRFK